MVPIICFCVNIFLSSGYETSKNQFLFRTHTGQRLSIIPVCIDRRPNNQLYL